jgi:hypothetical protein
VATLFRLQTTNASDESKNEGLDFFGLSDDTDYKDFTNNYSFSHSAIIVNQRQWAIPTITIFKS